MKLHLYFARKFASILLAVFLIFLTILMLLDVVDQIRRYDLDTITFAQALQLSALNVPAAVYRILPLVVILATLALYLNLSRTSELVVSRAAGRSALRSLIAPVLTALIAGLLCVAVFNPIVAATSKKYESLSSAYKTGRNSVLSINSDGLWLRQGDENGQMVIRARRANQEGTTLRGVTFLLLKQGYGPVFRIEAKEATLGQGVWAIKDAKRWVFDTVTGNPELSATTHQTLSLATDLTTERIRDSFGTPASIPIWELPDFIKDLDKAGFSARQHKMWLQMELALPAIFVAMVMIGAGFTMRHTRFGRIGIMVLSALSLGLALFFLRNFAQILGENGQLPIMLAAWSPPFIGIFLSLALLLHLEDG